MPVRSPVARAFRRDRVVVLLGLTAITSLAWAYTIRLAWRMDGMTGPMVMPQTQDWGLVELALLVLMWVVMMIAMMTPSASPMLLMYTKTLRTRTAAQGISIRSSLFVGGYLIAWTGFSVFAAAAQWELHAAALLSPTMVSTSALLGGILLIVAGVFQWTSVKHACLRRCRSPLGFVMTEWREGALGAFIMGLRHGLFCVGCCWALMALLFVTGVMNLLWIAAIAVFVLVEKIVPAGDRVARFAGILMTGYGILMIASTANG